MAEGRTVSWLGRHGPQPSRALREGGRPWRAWRLARRYDLALKGAGDLRGARVVDVGGAEGLFARRLRAAGAEQVTVVEPKHHRVAAGDEHARAAGVCFVEGSILDRLDLLDHCDTLVSLRCIYHMGPAVHDLFRAIEASPIRRVVLQGRSLHARGAPQHHDKLFGPPLGVLSGMIEILGSYGFQAEPLPHRSFPVAAGRR